MPKETLLTLLTILAFTAVSAASVSKRIESVVLQKVVPAYHRNDSDVSQKLLTNLISKLDEDELEEVNAILAEKGVPTVGELMLDARMNQVLARNEKLSKADPREAVLAMPVLHQRIVDLMAEVEGLEFYSDVLPEYKTLQEYEDAFWEIHVASNKLRNAARMSKYGLAFINRAMQGNLNSLSDEEVEKLDVDFESQGSQLAEIARELAEVKAELRIRAVTRATNIVRQSKDFKERLQAAYVIDFDGQQVIDFLRKHETTSFSRPMLRQEKLLESVLESVRYASESSSDLAVKSRLLYLGMHWWMRGRYGEGPEGMGLLKSKAALASPMAQFPLFMPIRPPSPTDPTLGTSVPRYDRRHQYIWMFEYRTIQTSVATRTRTTDHQVHYKERTSTKLSRFY